MAALVPPPSAIPAPVPRTFGDDVREAKTLSDVLKLTKPKMADTSGKASDGTIALMVWSMKNLRWADLQTLPDTTFAVVKKDSEEQRGKKICPSGPIIEIKKETIGDGKIFEGGMYDASRNNYQFIAVGSTGDLVEKKPARFCGIVTGNKSYSNSGGGTSHAVQLVGMFDLPENTKPTAPTASK